MTGSLAEIFAEDGSKVAIFQLKMPMCCPFQPEMEHSHINNNTSSEVIKTNNNLT